jgi:hypothetical protein
MLHCKFIAKGYGCIFVFKPEHIDKVRRIIRELDEFEYDYLPDGYIAVWDGEAKLCYTHKFELNIPELVVACGKRNIPIYCVTLPPETITF